MLKLLGIPFAKNYVDLHQRQTQGNEAQPRGIRIS